MHPSATDRILRVFLIALLFLVASSALAATVTLPAGSVDALADAITAAGPGGTVLVESGPHYESGTVTVSLPVTVQGEPGSVLEFDVPASNPAGPEAPLVVEPALHVLGADGVRLLDLDLRPVGVAGGTAVLIENAADTLVRGATMSQWQFGVLVEQGDRTEINECTIEVTPLWQTGELVEADGVIVINGDDARITDNRISGGIFGVFGSNRDGRASGNTLTGNFIGLLLCNVPPFFEISGRVVSSETPATGWLALGNESRGNFYSGYSVTDGSTANVLRNNGASDNGAWDIELLGDSCLFGFFTPTSVDTVVQLGGKKGLTVNDCAVGSVIQGEAIVTSVCETELPCRP